MGIKIIKTANDDDGDRNDDVDGVGYAAAAAAAAGDDDEHLSIFCLKNVSAKKLDI